MSIYILYLDILMDTMGLVIWGLGFCLEFLCSFLVGRSFLDIFFGIFFHLYRRDAMVTHRHPQH